jgi:RNA polymerase sigma-70 factor (ECF subfamily)
MYMLNETVGPTDEGRIGEESWDAVYRRVAPRLTAYCRRRLPAGDAEDAVSETMARAYAAAPRYRDRGLGVDAWVFGIGRNVVLDAQRRAGRHDPARVVGAWSPDEPGPLDAVLGDEEAGLLRLAFSRLTPEEQEVLELRVVAGLEADQVASVLGKKAGAVRMAQSRALARLRTLLTEVDR